MIYLRKSSPPEETLNYLSHGLGLGLAVVALVFLIRWASLDGDVWYRIALFAYGLSLVLLYFSSTFYHMLPMSPAKNRFQCLDHASIFVYIAGTYTPLLLISLGDTTAFILLGVVWLIAVFGMAYKAIWVEAYPLLTTAMYFAMGLMIMIVLQPLREAIGWSSFLLLLCGGSCYAVGLFFFSWQRLMYYHVIWHMFVLAGSACHFFAIYLTLPVVS